MVINRYSKSLLGIILSYYILVKKILNLLRFVEVEAVYSLIKFKLFFDDFRTKAYTLITDVYTMTCDELSNLILWLTTKRTLQFALIVTFCHLYHSSILCSLGNYFINQSIILGFFSSHEVITLCISFNIL